MPTPDLLVICGTALVAVFLVLTFLAAVMQLLIRAFPHTDTRTDAVEPTLVAAISEGVTAAYPGTRVTAIEELK